MNWEDRVAEAKIRRESALSARRSPVGLMKLPRNLSGERLAKALCKSWGYQKAH